MTVSVILAAFLAAANAAISPDRWVGNDTVPFYAIVKDDKYKDVYTVWWISMLTLFGGLCCFAYLLHAYWHWKVVKKSATKDDRRNVGA